MLDNRKFWNSLYNLQWLSRNKIPLSHRDGPSSSCVSSPPSPQWLNHSWACNHSSVRILLLGIWSLERESKNTNKTERERARDPLWLKTRPCKLGNYGQPWSCSITILHPVAIKDEYHVFASSFPSLFSALPESWHYSFGEGEYSERQRLAVAKKCWLVIKSTDSGLGCLDSDLTSTTHWLYDLG